MHLLRRKYSYRSPIGSIARLTGIIVAAGVIPSAAAQEKTQTGQTVPTQPMAHVARHRSEEPKGGPRGEPSRATLALTRKIEAYVQQGNLIGARNAAKQIPEPEWRDAALGIIASSQAIQKDFAGAKQTVWAMRFPLHQAHTLAFIAGTEEMHARKAEAQKTRASARKIALAISHTVTRDAALGNLADAYLRSGDITSAKHLAVRIQNPRRRFLPLARIARQQAETGDLIGAQKTIGQAREAAGREKPSYERDTFLKEAFFVETRVGDLDGALQTAQEMYDAFARTSSLAEVARLLAKAGSRVAARRTIQEARTAFPLIQDSYAKDSVRLLLVKALVEVRDIMEASRVAAEIFDPQKKEQALQEIARGRRGGTP